MIPVRTLTLAALAAALAVPSSARAAAAVGQPAPEVSLPDTTGATRSLSAYKGKFVVLEWVNFECPFVGKHYGSGHMQKLQKDYTSKGVVWLSVNSSRAGSQGYYASDKVNALIKEKGAAPTAYLLDTAGTVGRAYGARTTPHMFIVDASGKIAYNGAIDDDPSGRQPKAKRVNYVGKGLDAEQTGGKPDPAATKPYGCTVKY